MSGEAPPVSSAPTTTEVAESVVESYEPSEPSTTPDLTADTRLDSTPPDPPSTEPARPETIPAVVEPPLTDEEKLLREFGFKHATKPDGRQHYIPRDKVLQMIASGLKRGSEKWGGERTTIEQERDKMRADLDEMYTDLRGEPKAFLEKIAQHDPRYRALLEPPAAPVPAQPLFAQAFPEPDLPLSDGSRTFSLQAIQDKVVPWLEAKIAAGLDAKVEERLKPLTDREQQAKRADEQRQQDTALRERARSQVTDLTKMPMFGTLNPDGTLTPFQTEVLEVLRAESRQAAAERRRPTMTAKEAYWEVASKKLTADRNTQREELIKELNANASRTPAVARSGEAPRQTGPLSTADHAARVLARLEKS